MKSSKNVETSKADRGQTIVRSFGRDNSSHDVPNSHGKEMGGSTTNLSHSLSGASAVQKK
jgi:hypothetical protein